MSLNGVIALILLYFIEFDCFAGLTSLWLKIDLYCLQNIVLHFRPKLTHPAARSLCDSWATCIIKLQLFGGAGACFTWHLSVCLKIPTVNFKFYQTCIFGQRSPIKCWSSRYSKSSFRWLSWKYYVVTVYQ